MSEREDSPHNCQSCDRPDEAEAEMVECRICKLWEHFGCAAVDERVKQRGAKYICKSCSARQKTSSALEHNLLKPTNVQTKTAKSTKATSKTSSRRSKTQYQSESLTSSTRAAFLAEKLKLIEEEKVMKEQELAEQDEIRKRQLEEEERQLEEKRKLTEEAKMIRERKLEEELNQKRKVQQVRRESFEKRKEILRQMSEASSRGSSAIDSEEKVCNWLSDQAQGNRDLAETHKNYSVSFVPTMDPAKRVESNKQPVVNALHNQPMILPVINPPQISHTPTTPYANDNMLQPAQVNARHVIGRDLPTFTGTPEDWPLFLSHFEQTTAAGGYSDAENLIRLQRCLKGSALEAVRSRLLIPSSVPSIIQTLRTLFGRPELIIRSLLRKVDQIPSPKAGNNGSLLQYGIAVQNLVDTIKAAGQANQLSNPNLMGDLVAKLPATVQLNWAEFRMQCEPANLESLGQFMSRLVEKLSLVCYELPEIGNISLKDKRKPKVTGNIYTHVGECSKHPENTKIAYNKYKKTCVCCGREGHKLVECQQFKGASVDERWKFVQQKGLCRTCLNSHGKYPCRSWVGCGIEKCRQRHHTLLHNSAFQKENVSISASHVSSGEFQWPLFRIVPVNLYGDKEVQTVFAFIDEGSSYSLLEDSIAEKLGLRGKDEPLTLQWTGNVSRVESKSQRVQLDISGKDSTSRYKGFCARTVTRLVLPLQTLKYKALAKRFPHLRGLPVE